MATSTRPVIEQRAIDHIPHEERHGTVRSLFTLWFSANMQITTVVTGALAIVFGLDLFWGLIALLIGNLLGGIFMAYHSAQGPKLGIPQMIQSRAQFGFYGAILPLVLVIVMYLGYFASSAVLGGEAISGSTSISTTGGILIMAVVCTILAIVGYDLIHRYESLVSLVFAVGFLYLTIRIVTQHDVGALLGPGSFSLAPFLLVISLAATWQITYAPYVADYSRYLPYETTVASTFWYTYLGSVIGTFWMMGLGALIADVASKSFDANSSAYVANQAGSALSGVFYLIIVLGVIAANVLNLYGFFMSITTTLTALVPIPFRQNARIILILIAAIIGSALAIAGQGNFLTNYSNFLLVLLYFLVPWTAINLVDFYLIRHGNYDLDSIYTPRGIYGPVNWRALLAYIVAVAVEVPFINQSLYEGPLAKAFGGADIAWILGLIVAGGLYYLLMRDRVSATAPQDISAVPTR